jgi:hypothetical protein
VRAFSPFLGRCSDWFNGSFVFMVSRLKLQRVVVRLETHAVKDCAPQRWIPRWKRGMRPRVSKNQTTDSFRGE